MTTDKDFWTAIDALVFPRRIPKYMDWHLLSVYGDYLADNNRVKEERIVREIIRLRKFPKNALTGLYLWDYYDELHVDDYLNRCNRAWDRSGLENDQKSSDRKGYFLPVSEGKYSYSLPYYLFYAGEEDIPVSHGRRSSLHHTHLTLSRAYKELIRWCVKRRVWDLSFKALITEAVEQNLDYEHQTNAYDLLDHELI